MLTDLVCKNAQPDSKTYKLSDSGGLYLEVTPKGHRWWRLKYRLHGKEKRLSLGVYPKVSLLEARQKREDIKRDIGQYIDPSLKRREEKLLEQVKAAQTFELVALEWHKRYLSRWSKSHADNLLTRLNVDIIPVIGSYPIAKLTPPILLQCIQKIESRSGDQARRALNICSQVLRHAVVTGRAERDFSADLRGSLLPIRRKHFAAIDYTGIPDLLKKLKANEGRLYRKTVLAFFLLLLTFVRTRELIEARRSEFNLEKAVWTIPAERMKMRIEHVVPLSRQALEIVKELMKTGKHSEYLFPSVAKPKKPMSNGTILMALRRMGYDKKMTGHGFRSLAMSTIKEKLGYQHEVIDRQLSHLPRSAVDRAYDRAKYIPDRTKMMQDWADYIDSQSS